MGRLPKSSATQTALLPVPETCDTNDQVKKLCVHDGDAQRAMDNEFKVQAEKDQEKNTSRWVRLNDCQKDALASLCSIIKHQFLWQTTGYRC